MTPRPTADNGYSVSYGKRGGSAGDGRPVGLEDPPLHNCRWSIQPLHSGRSNDCGSYGGWVDSTFFNHAAQDASVDFDGVHVGKNLGDENALPAF